MSCLFCNGQHSADFICSQQQEVLQSFDSGLFQAHLQSSLDQSGPSIDNIIDFIASTTLSPAGMANAEDASRNSLDASPHHLPPYDLTSSEIANINDSVVASLLLSSDMAGSQDASRYSSNPFPMHIRQPSQALPDIIEDWEFGEQHLSSSGSGLGLQDIWRAVSRGRHLASDSNMYSHPAESENVSGDSFPIAGSSSPSVQGHMTQSASLSCPNVIPRKGGQRIQEKSSCFSTNAGSSQMNSPESPETVQRRKVAYERALFVQDLVAWTLLGN